MIGRPQDSFYSIHIAGTNGKGSVCTFLELLYLQDKSVKIGKYLSPHLVSVCERISIDGKNITQDEYDRLWMELFEEADNGILSSHKLTEFEQMTVLAFEYFKRKKVEIAILEVGLGGRWDATNVIKPQKTLATAVTNISFDHMDYLGNSLQEIRAEKEGIKKDGVPHFEGVSQKSLVNSKNGENFLLALEIFQYLNHRIKRDNIVNQQSNVTITELVKDKIMEQFKNRYKGRFDYDAQKNILVDGAHNPAGARELNRFLKQLTKERVLLSVGSKIFILGFLDKDYRNSINELLKDFFDPENDYILFCRVNSDRSTDPQVLQDYVKELLPAFTNCFIFESLKLALIKADQIVTKDLIIISGSLYLAGEYYYLAETHSADHLSTVQAF